MLLYAFIINQEEIFPLIARVIKDIDNYKKMLNYKGIPLCGIIEGEEKDKSGILYRYLLSKRLELRRLVLENQIQTTDFIIFIDDCIGTGKQASSYLKKFIEKNNIIERNIKVLLISLFGYKEGVSKLQNEIGDSCEIITLELLDDNERILSLGFIFKEEEISYVEEFLEKYGEKAFAKGFDNCQSIMVFRVRCSNNVPSFLWKSQDGWSLLFPRFPQFKAYLIQLKLKFLIK